MARVRPSTIVYFPNNIGQGQPASSTTFAFLVEGKDDNGATPMLIMNALLKRGARILSQSGYLLKKYKEFTLSLTCDLEEVKATADDLVIQLRGMKHVTHAEAISLKNMMFDGLLFPLILMDTNRVVAINANLMFEIQERLKTQTEKSILIEAGRDYGKDIVNRIRQKFEANKNARPVPPPPSMQTIEENVKGYLRTAGWGKFDWKSEENVEQIFIQDPPMSSSEGSGAGNLFLHGMVAGMTEAFRKKWCCVMEDLYDPQTRVLSLALVEQSLVRSAEPRTRAEALSQQEKSRALHEIEKIIASVEREGSQETKPAEQNAPGEKGQEIVVDIPVIDSGNRVHIALKRGSGAGSNFKEQTVEQEVIQPINLGPRASNERTLELAQPRDQPEQKDNGLVKAEKAAPEAAEKKEVEIISNKNKEDVRQHDEESASPGGPFQAPVVPSTDQNVGCLTETLK
ncbi:MAG: hypothetical protein ACREBS_07455, partial [Nitrososphaerales archaeon]